MTNSEVIGKDDASFLKGKLRPRLFSAAVAWQLVKSAVYRYLVVWKLQVERPANPVK